MAILVLERSFPFSEGVLLSTWSSKMRKVHCKAKAGGDFLVRGYRLGSGIGIKSINASVLEFDFVPLTNFISFDYIFASMSIKIISCEFSDGFAFFLSGK
jgi:hypothetical protein